MKIGFYQPHLDIQGTGVSYYDYATYNESILGNKSYMICDKNDDRTHPLAEKKFKQVLQVFELDGKENMQALSSLCKDLQLDALYIQKCGLKNDGRFIETVPTFIHVVGIDCDPHGTVYAYVSDWLSDYCSNKKFPVVPYMVHLPDTNEDLRDRLNIPKDAIVFGRTGGTYSWNIYFVNQVIEQILKDRKDVYFLFVNTPVFTNHERVLFVEPFADLTLKRKFINTCDALIHARSEGESYGATVAEYSYCNKPVITYAHSQQRNHIHTLGDKAILYTDPNSLYGIFNNFKKEPEKDWNCYKQFTPEYVMSRFNDVFIKAL